MYGVYAGISGILYGVYAEHMYGVYAWKNPGNHSNLWKKAKTALSGPLACIFHQ